MDLKNVRHSLKDVPSFVTLVRLRTVSRITYCLSLTVCCLLFIAGCEQTFQPIKENNLYYYSIYGYLDASADTQWVRVAPAREQIDMPPVVPDMRVTLEHQQSGNTVVMNDSLFVTDNGSNVLNFWTTMDIGNRQTYRLRAERPDGAASRVTVTTPGELPTPRVRKETSPVAPTTYSVYVDDAVEHLVDIQMKWYVRLRAPGFEERRVFSFSHRNSAELISAYGGVYTVYIQPAEEMERIEAQTNLPPEGEIEVLHRQVYVASGGPEWNEEIPLLDDLAYALPGNISNVEDGLGYVFGIDSKFVPLKSCFNDKALLIPCPEEEPYW